MSENTQHSDLKPFAARLHSRRSFLSTAGLITGGILLASPGDALAFFWNTPRSSASTVAIPEEWINHFGPSVRDYVAYLQRLRLKRITIQQIIEAHRKQRGKVKNAIPPKQLWKNIRPTLLAADRLCDKLGEPVRNIVSAYRSPQYNARCPGARSNSFHVRNMALDLQFRSSSRQVALAARELREKGVFSGGVGRYSSFTHIDTRGKKADW